MFVASDLAMPRRGVTMSSSGASVAVTPVARGASAGIGVLRAAVFVVRGAGWVGAASGNDDVGATVVATGTGAVTG